MAPSSTGTDTETESDTDTSAVIEGSDAKAIHDREVIPPRPTGSIFNCEVRSWLAQYGIDYKQLP